VEAAVAVADRALLVASPLSALTVDTQDPESGIGHAVTFSDPVIGYGKLVKQGAGTLVLASDANAVTGGVSVVEGALAWTVDQSMPSLAVEPGTSLLFGWNGSEASVLTVESDLDLTGVNVRPVAGSPSFAGRNTVIAAANGAKITGTPILPEGYDWSITDDGSALQLHKGMGMSIIFR
jgi:autotransporter-associated beta strand protein